MRALVILASFMNGDSLHKINGNSFTKVGQVSETGYYRQVWGDGTHVYLANSTDGLRAYTFD